MARPTNTASLQSWLRRPTRAAHALSYHAAEGFLFAVACSPELVAPSEWIPVICGDEPEFDSVDEANGVIADLMTLYNDINATIHERTPRLPADCPVHLDPMANLEPGSPVSEWSRGFRIGHHWLIETWDELLPEGLEPELDAEIGSVLMTLTFFSSRQLAERYHADTSRGTLAEMATLVHRLFGRAMESYAIVGRTVGGDAARAEASTPHRAPVAGRNDPCPCGSRRKYKKCCGSPTAH
jgi:uncharacterized protein